MSWSLRPYQTKLIDDLASSYQRHRTALAMMPTGAGKTSVASALIRDRVDRGQRILFLAHRRELIDQAAARLRTVGIRSGIVMGGHHGADPRLQVQVASVQTLVRRQRPPADLVIVDEAHHASAGSYAKILDDYPHAQILGLTATPARLDGKGLGELFQDLVLGPSVADLIEEGHLVMPRIWCPPMVDTSGVGKRAGDYSLGELAGRAAAITGDVVSHWQRLAPGRKTVAFAVNVEHSQGLVAAFRAAGIAAEHLDGTTPEELRTSILRRLRDGTTTIVSNVGILTEGWDLPALECVILARPTMSVSLYLQMIGRVMRPADGKDAIVLDHAGCVLMHGGPEMPRAWSLEGAPMRDVEEGPKVCRCKECYFVWPAVDGRTCPSCGKELPAPTAAELRRIEQRDGELQEYKPDGWTDDPKDWKRRFRPVAGFPVLEARKREAFDWLCGLRKSKSWKWVGIEYKDLFGEWPPGDWLRPVRRQWENEQAQMAGQAVGA